MCRVAVVVPLYNKSAYVERAVRSALAQTVPAHEIMVVDDGSTDGGGDIVRSVRDPRVHLISQENRGVSAARNTGVACATSDLVAFLDADDEWLPEFLETVLRLRTRYPAAGAYATAYWTQGSSSDRVLPRFACVPDEPEGGIIADYFLAGVHGLTVCSSAIMLPKHVLADIGGFPVGVALGEDLDTWARLALKYAIAWYGQPQAVYHVDTGSWASRGLCIGDVAFAPLLESYIAGAGRSDPRIRSVQEYLAKHRLQYAGTNYLAGNTGLGRSLVAKTTHTKLFRRQWLFWRVMTSMPHSVVVAAWKANQIAHGRRPVLPPLGAVRRGAGPSHDSEACR